MTAGPADALQAAKARLRPVMLKLRAQADRDVATRMGAARALADHIAELASQKCLAGYIPLPAEADPRPAMALHAGAPASGALCLPVVTRRDAALSFRAWSAGAALERGAFGTRVPTAGAWLCPDVVIVPLVGFDARGYRLGYGGGFYDRSLAALRASGRPVLAVGLAYSAQEADLVPTEATDIALDAIVTEAGLRWFGASPPAAVGPRVSAG